MLTAFERFVEALFAPIGAELARLPDSAFRFVVRGVGY
jgi:hypothetical protein